MSIYISIHIRPTLLVVTYPYTMSVASNISHISVNHHGKVVTVESALDETVRDLQQHLNQLQCKLRAIAALSDQQTGDLEDGDFSDLKESVKQTDELEDHIQDMIELFEDLKDIAGQLAYLPETPAERTWLKDHKTHRKAHLAERKKQAAEQRKANKTAAKSEEAKRPP